MNHEELLKEAEQLAKTLGREEKIDWAFRYSYIQNHELRAALIRLDEMRKQLASQEKMMLALLALCGSVVFGGVVVIAAKLLIG